MGDAVADDGLEGAESRGSWSGDAHGREEEELLVIAVVGATGVGKSAAARALREPVGSYPGGEILSADALQIWDGLPIATNQEVVPVLGPLEKHGCPACHGAAFRSTTADSNAASSAGAVPPQPDPQHLVGYLNPPSSAMHDANFTVCDWVRDADGCLGTIRSKGLLPLVTGGTHMYLDALLWEGNVTPTENNSSITSNHASLGTDEAQSAIADTALREHASAAAAGDLSARAKLHAALASLHPAMATKLHANDFRRVRRGLEIVRDGVVDEKSAASPLLRKGDRLLVVWVKCSRDTLFARLDERIDAMVRRGLVEELYSFYTRTIGCFPEPSIAGQGDHSSGSSSRVDTARDDAFVGPFAAIGFKEFLPYLQERHRLGLRGEEINSCLDALVDSCIQRLKVHTKRYARQQESWIARHLIPRLLQLHTSDSALPGGAISNNQWLAMLDSTEADCWQEQLSSLRQIASAFASNDQPVLARALDSVRANVGNVEVPKGDWQKYDCEICSRTMNGAQEWEAHLKSRNHRARQRKNSRKSKRRRIGPGPESADDDDDDHDDQHFTTLPDE